MFAGEDRAGRRHVASDEEHGLRHLGGGTLRRPIRTDMSTTPADVC